MSSPIDGYASWFDQENDPSPAFCPACSSGRIDGERQPCSGNCRLCYGPADVDFDAIRAEYQRRIVQARERIQSCQPRRLPDRNA